MKKILASALLFICPGLLLAQIDKKIKRRHSQHRLCAQPVAA
jgi:hypothetical protein